MSDDYVDRSDEEREWAVTDGEDQGDLLASMVNGAWLDSQEFPPLEFAVEGFDKLFIGLNPHDNLRKHVMPAYDIDPASLGNVELTLQLRLKAFLDLSGNPVFDLSLR